MAATLKESNAYHLAPSTHMWPERQTECSDRENSGNTVAYVDLVLTTPVDQLKNSGVWYDGQSKRVLVQYLLQTAWIVTIYAFTACSTLYIGSEDPDLFYVSECPIRRTRSIVQDISPEATVQSLIRQVVATHQPEPERINSSSTIVRSRTEGEYDTAISYSQECGPNQKESLNPEKTPIHLIIRAVSDDQLYCKLYFQPTRLNKRLALSLLYTLSEAVTSISRSPTRTLQELELCSPHDTEYIRRFTARVSPANNSLVHELCLRHVRTSPDAPAVRSWDGDLTYRELDDVTTRLAHHLVGLGVKPETFVLSCFAKSTWAIVSRLAILKAGGAYISIDAQDPPAYLDSVIQRSKTSIMLTTPTFAAKFKHSFKFIVEVDSESVARLPLLQLQACQTVQPGNACLVLFTSGSTGKPKGIIQEHRSYATAICDYVRLLEMGPHSRVFQFDDYAFDISNNDYMTALVAGGCCCVPTPERTIAALKANINLLNSNTTFLTPTIAIQLQPEDVPNLKVLCIGGESPSSDLLEKWCEHVKLINQYGMGEVATFCAYNDNVQRGSGSIIGRPGSGAIWVVNPASPERLMPVGAVGEILIEGPHLARGYLDSLCDKSDAGFLQTTPEWLAYLHPQRGKTRFYRSGDLGRYRHDGTVEHMGRKDTLLKLNGCRVEAVEVEYFLRSCLSTDDAVVVNLLGALDGKEEPALTAFLYLSKSLVDVSSNVSDGISFQPVTQTHFMSPLVERMTNTIRDHLPVHMVPSLFLLVNEIPRTKSNKTDRRKLQLYAQEWYMTNRADMNANLLGNVKS